MTCQWCVHFRYKKGPVCERPEGDGKTLPSKGRNFECEWFSPRKTCTTCEYRCLPDGQGEHRKLGVVCPRWMLRKVSPWGGRRRAKVALIPKTEKRR